MAAVKRIATVGLIMALAVPTIVYGAEKAGYSQPIKDTKNQQAGVFGCEKDTEEWAKEIILTASAVPDSGKTLPEISFLWREDQDDTVSTGKTYTVKENGIYTVTIQLPEGSGLTAEDIQVDVQNIDTTGPEIVSVTKDVSEWTSGAVKITVECEDYQKAEDDTEKMDGEIAEEAKGSGLHLEGAYSFDGGKTWTTDNFVTVEENTTIDFVVRDALENTTKQSITVDNIDKSEPAVRLGIVDGGVLYEGEGGSLRLSASASDAHSGLADQPNSWDGGVSWTGNSIHTVTEAGDYTVLVRDRAGNYTQATVTVNYAQRTSDMSGSGTGNSPASSNGSGYVSENNGIGTVYYGVPAAMAGTVNNNVSESTDESVKETEENKETRETESQESVRETETEAAESENLKTPVVQTNNTSGFPIRWVLLVIAAAAIIMGIIVVAKLISERQTVAAGWDDDDREDMEKVYARVSEKESQTLKAAAPVSAVQNTEVQDRAGDTIQLDTEVIEEAMAEVETVETPVAETPVEDIKTTADAATVEIPEVEAEPVVLEGAHSRLTYDPATGEYRYEFK